MRRTLLTRLALAAVAVIAMLSAGLLIYTFLRGINPNLPSVVTTPSRGIPSGSPGNVGNVPRLAGEVFIRFDTPDGWLLTPSRDEFTLHNPQTLGADDLGLPLTLVRIKLLPDDGRSLEALARSYTAEFLADHDTIELNEPQILPLADELTVSITGKTTIDNLKLDLYTIYRAFPDERRVVMVYAQTPEGRMESHAAVTRQIAASLDLARVLNYAGAEITPEVTPEITSEVMPEVTAEVRPEVTLEAAS